MQRLLRFARSEVWWVAPQLIMVVVLSVTVGLWGLWMAYAAFNSGLVWLYADHHGGRNPRRQQVLKVLAIVLLPVGFLSVIATGGGPTVSDKAGAASDDESVREATAKATGRGWSGGLK